MVVLKNLFTLDNLDINLNSLVLEMKRCLLFNNTIIILSIIINNSFIL